MDLYQSDMVMTPERIIDYPAKIEFWRKEVESKDGTHKDLVQTEGVNGVIGNVLTVITRLHIAVHTSQTGRVD